MDKKINSKSEQIRMKILAAAASVVGSDGYEKATIVRITQEAGISTGLFYYYFANREELLNQLLPEIGHELIAFIAARIRLLPLGVEREIASFEAYFAFLGMKPEFYRVFSEAPVHTPVAYEAHFRLIIENYIYSLRQQKKAGFLKVPDSELIALAYSLTGIRNYMTQLLYKSDPTFKSKPRNFARTYRRFLAGGIFDA